MSNAQSLQPIDVNDAKTLSSRELGVSSILNHETVSDEPRDGHSTLTNGCRVLRHCRRVQVRAALPRSGGVLGA